MVPDEWQVYSGWWYVLTNSDINHSQTDDIGRINIKHKENRNVRPTEELAEACLAMSQLAQLRNETWKRDWDWESDWINSDYPKFVIEIVENKVKTNKYYWIQGFLAFRTPEIRDEFLEKHIELIEKAKPLL
jgi:hypothetical protein